MRRRGKAARGPEDLEGRTPLVRAVGRPPHAFVWSATATRPGPGRPAEDDAHAGPGASRRPPGRFHFGFRWPRLAWYQEILCVILGDFLYEIIRALAPQHAAEAFHDAAMLTALQPAPVQALEVWMRDVTVDHPALVALFGVYYAALHLTVTSGVLVWLWWRRPQQYARARTMLFALTFGALLIFWIFPVAPPRLVTPEAINAFGTPAMAALDGGGIGSAVGTLVNPYAAFPSLHVGWAAWCAWAVWAHVRGRYRWTAWLYPLATSIVVIGTANHYVIDVLAGLLLVVVAAAARTSDPEQDPAPAEGPPTAPAPA